MQNEAAFFMHLPLREPRVRIFCLVKERYCPYPSWKQERSDCSEARASLERRAHFSATHSKRSCLVSSLQPRSPAPICVRVRSSQGRVRSVRGASPRVVPRAPALPDALGTPSFAFPSRLLSTLRSAHSRSREGRQNRTLRSRDRS